MPLPPEDIPADVLWTALQEMPRPQRPVDYPRRDPITGEWVGRVVIQVLSHGELMSAAAAADKYTMDLLRRSPRKDETSYGYDTIYNNESSVQTLFRAVRRENAPSLPFFPSPDHIRELPIDEIGALVRMYLIVQRELGPVVSQMRDGEMEAWVQRLVEGGSAFPLASLDSEGVNDLVMLMARRLHSFLTATTSSGSPQSGSTSSTS